MLEIRSLAGVGWEALAAAFEAAFADYAVKLTLTPAALAATQIRRGYAPACSFGAFDGDRLVGFALTCLDGDRAYNSGTGVVPAQRRAGLARRLVEAVIASAPARSYVLEVIDSNTGAAALYRGLGFVETRGLQGWAYAPSAAPGVVGFTEHTGPEAIAALAALAGDFEFEPSWQNALPSLRRATEPCVALAGEHGAALVFPSSGDLPLLCVRRAARRRGHGARLLAAAAARAGRPLRLLNLDERAAGLASFLAASGATPLVRQLEMVRPL